ncbi:hypothetical protein PHYSODRAFT_302821 [Phytophthora sojae]|uniref:Uncharacterized protein n=1 Tax=Phytophthora sojae (strain P6497) TaxID=1094619 RepID=G4ZSX3_PHYSP|nr:hypothetical protein PHYSODRAFT_302821 [Phytophthora sojae]EGZ13058.1 hypothetical protein PHYSODRAFT_302821 [Phytophthora sojae]|eukprot:XP_009530487.1 hypothetical protein PHYSODRAFT_302821 [Phytophthora sojae]
MWVYVPTDSGIRSIYSAIADAGTVKRLKIRPECDFLVEDVSDVFEEPMTPAHWCWLAYALWSRAAKPNIRKLDLQAITLTDKDVSAIENVLQSSYPDPATRGSHENESQLPQYGYVTVQAGTEVVSVDCEDAVLVMASNCRCRALYDPSTIVIPGYGICKAKLMDGHKSFVADPPVPPGVF